MKFDQLLDNIDEFDGELIVADLFESVFGFCWDKKTRFTAEGKNRFKQILESDVKINNDVIILQDKHIKEEDYDLFMSAVAGYVPCSDYDKWFEKR